MSRDLGSMTDWQWFWYCTFPFLITLAGGIGTLIGVGVVIWNRFI